MSAAGRAAGRANGIGWLGIVRLGLVQTALGAIVLLTTSTLNRVMIVELGLAAVVPGALVGLHYGVQIARPLWGHGSDRGGRRTPWIVGGVALLALAGTGAASATALMADDPTLGLVLAALAFALIGVGIGAAGTSLLALLASSVAPERRASAATVVWVMMILGIAVTGIVTGTLLDPFSMPRLVAVTAVTGLAAFALTSVAVYGVERAAGPALPAPRRPIEERQVASTFRESLVDALSDRQARLFTVFVFVSMVAYSFQELILEPFAGLVFQMTPGETTTLSGLQNGGVFLGMALAGLSGSLLSRRMPGILTLLTVGGCLLSGVSLALLAAGAMAGPGWPLLANVVALGFFNGVFAVAAIASMMALAGGGGPSRVGLRMGLWGAAQAIGFGLGGLSGTIAIDLGRLVSPSVPVTYAGAFLFEGLIFLVSAVLAARVAVPRPAPRSAPSTGRRPTLRRHAAGLEAAE